MAAALQACTIFNAPKAVAQALVGIIFLFQNSYQYLLYTQQWSFVSTVLTPEQGSRWFAGIAGLSSVFSSILGTIVPYLLPYTGLLGLMASTCITLTLCLIAQDKAYSIAQANGFDPADTQTAKEKKQKAENKDSKLRQAVDLFKRVPTLRALLSEVLSFQSLNTILNVAFIGVLKSQIPDDLARSAFTGRFYASINAAGAALQFIVLPPFMKRAEPKWIWRVMPIIPTAFCLANSLQYDLSLSLIAGAFYITKVMDYSFRSVVYAMVYQPLDFESRYVGKEIIGVFGSRFGKSGMALLVSAFTALFGGAFGLRQLSWFAFGISSTWLSSTMWLSSLLPRKAEAQAIVEERVKQQKLEEKPKTE
jgi:ATP/ADP translocase